MTATVTRGSRAIASDSVGLEHLLTSGYTLTGVVPSKNYPDNYTVLGGTEGEVSPTAVANRATLSVASPSSGDGDTAGVAESGNGLYDPKAVFSDVRGKSFWITGVHIITDTAWTLYVTSGLDDGDATTIDDPVNDVALLRSTGGLLQSISVELPVNSRVRVVTDTAVGVDSRFCVRFTLTSNEAGRLIA